MIWLGSFSWIGKALNQQFCKLNPVLCEFFGAYPYVFVILLSCAGGSHLICFLITKFLLAQFLLQAAYDHLTAQINSFMQEKKSHLGVLSLM